MAYKTTRAMYEGIGVRLSPDAVELIDTIVGSQPRYNRIGVNTRSTWLRSLIYREFHRLGYTHMSEANVIEGITEAELRRKSQAHQRKMLATSKKRRVERANRMMKAIYDTFWAEFAGKCRAC